MLLIGTPVRTTEPVELGGDDTRYLPAGYEGFIDNVQLDKNGYPYQVLFNIADPDNLDEYLRLSFDPTEFEVLAKDICYCHLMQGKGQGEMAVCGVCA